MGLAFVGHTVNCEDDPFPPPPPAPVSPEIWSVEFARTWAPGELVELEFAPVSDPCGPVTYGMFIEKRSFAPGSAWIRLDEVDGLAQPLYRLEWPEHAWGRYRAYAVDANGAVSLQQGWRYFMFAGIDPPSEDRLVSPPG